jgi:hypothetical protein
MTDLRRRILEELQRRNFSETTIKTYLRVIEDFAQYFGKRPDRGSTKYICCKSGSSQSRRFGCTLPPCYSSTLRHCDVGTCLEIHPGVISHAAEAMRIQASGSTYPATYIRRPPGTEGCGNVRHS